VLLEEIAYINDRNDLETRISVAIQRMRHYWSQHEGARLLISAVVTENMITGLDAGSYIHVVTKSGHLSHVELLDLKNQKDSGEE